MITRKKVELGIYTDYLFLKKHVEVLRIGPGLWLRCLDCRAEWSPNTRNLPLFGKVLERDWCRCPHGCNDKHIKHEYISGADIGNVDYRLHFICIDLRQGGTENGT